MLKVILPNSKVLSLHLIMQNQNQPALKRELGAKSLALNAINLTVGAGIFVLPALIAQKLGSAAFIAYIVCGLLIILIMLCFAEVGSKVTTSGGSYAYVEKAFGPFAGFLINTLFWFGFASLADAAVINAMADALKEFNPAFSEKYIRIGLFILVFAVLALINIRGVKSGSQFAVTVTLLKLTPLILMIVLGLFSITSTNLIVTKWPGVNEIGQASLTLFFAFMGTEAALNISGEIKDPQRSIPKGVLMGVTGIVIIYLLIQFVAQGVLGNQLAAETNAPLAATGAKLIGVVGGTILVVTSIVSMFGLLSSDMLAEPRLLFAASKDKLLPDFLAKVHPRFFTPYWSIIVFAVCSIILASSGGFEQLANLASSAMLIIYLTVVLAMIRLRFKKDDTETGGFKIPFGLTVPVLAIAIIGWLLSHVTMKEIKSMAIFFVVLTFIYFINKFVRKNSASNAG